MKIKSFPEILTLALARSGRTDAQFAAESTLHPSTLSSYKIGRIFPTTNNLEKIINQFRNRPHTYNQLLISYLLDSAPTGYRADLSKLIEDQDFTSEENHVAEADTPIFTPAELELEAALARILQRAEQKKHIRDLLLILGKSPIRLKSGT